MLAIGLAATATGCLFYGYDTEQTVTRLTSTQYPPTSYVAVYFYPPPAQGPCVPIAIVEVTGNRHDTTQDLLPKLRQGAASVGADALFSVSVGKATRERGEALTEVLDPKKRPSIYGAHYISGIAARCVPPQPAQPIAAPLPPSDGGAG